VNSVVRGVVSMVVLGLKVVSRGCMFAVKPMSKRCGRDVIFHPFDSFTHSTISIGNHVSIEKGAVFLASESAITIGKQVMFGPCVMIKGGTTTPLKSGAS